MTSNVLEEQLENNHDFKNLSMRDKLICSLYHIDGVSIKDIITIRKENVVDGVFNIGKRVYLFSNLTRKIADLYDFDLLCVGKKRDTLSVRGVQLIQAKVRFTDLPIVDGIVKNLDMLFDENLSLDEALDKTGLDLTNWKYPISKDGAMFKPYYNKGTGFSKTKKGFVYVLKYMIGKEEFLKFGITSDIKKRLGHSKRMNNSLMELLFYKQYRTGEEALDVENKIKRSVPCGVVGKDVLPDGYTETCDLKYLNKLKEIIAP